MKLSDPSFVTTPQAACVSLYGTEPKESRPDLLHFLIFSALTQNNRAEATWRGEKKMKQEREMGEDEEKVIKEPRRGEKRWVNVQKSKDEKKQKKRLQKKKKKKWFHIQVNIWTVSPKKILNAQQLTTLPPLKKLRQQQRGHFY